MALADSFLFFYVSKREKDIVRLIKGYERIGI